MYRSLCRIGAALAMALLATAAQAQVQVIATTSDLRSLVEAIGGERVAAVNLVSPRIDAEEYQPLPKDLERLRNADLVVRVGADYDLWLDRLLAKAGKPALYPGQPGYVDASLFIPLLEVRGNAVGTGHAHGSGNPHYWLDPENAKTITAHIMDALIKLDRPSEKFYRQRHAQFLDRLQARQQAWADALAPSHGQAVIAYHNSWAYFARRFRIRIEAVIEEKPGVAPSPARIANLLRVMRRENISVIIRQPHEPVRDPEFLASRAGAAVVVLAASVDAVPAARDYISLLDYNVNALATAMKPRQKQ